MRPYLTPVNLGAHSFILQVTVYHEVEVVFRSIASSLPPDFLRNRQTELFLVLHLQLQCHHHNGNQDEGPTCINVSEEERRS